MLSVIVPAYNKERSIKSKIKEISGALNKVPHEIIVSCEGSTDKTEQKVKQLCRESNQLKIISGPKRKGKGYGVKQGIKCAKGSLLCFIDADNSIHANEIINLLKYSKKYDLIIASRKTRGAKVVVKQNLLERFGSFCWNLFFIRLLMGIPVKDSQCGLKVFSRCLADKWISKSKIDGFAFDAELLWIAKKEGMRIKEVPIVWRTDEISGRSFSTFSVPSWPQFFIDALRIRFS